MNGKVDNDVIYISGQYTIHDWSVSFSASDFGITNCNTYEWFVRLTTNLWTHIPYIAMVSTNLVNVKFLEMVSDSPGTNTQVRLAGSGGIDIAVTGVKK